MAVATKPNVSVSAGDANLATKPCIDEVFKFVGGKKQPWTGDTIEVTSPIVDEKGNRIHIGRHAAFTAEDAKDAVEAAAKAWDKGQGKWPQMTIADRIGAVESFLEVLEESRDQIVNAVMWEICKNSADAAAEYDRTMTFIRSAIAQLKTCDDIWSFGKWTSVSGVRGRVRRGPLGVGLMLAPFNYPLNEMYAMMMPALLMGNTIVLKLPAVGGLAHILTVDALQKAFPEGVVNFVTGSGRTTMGPIMQTGLIDVIGFIGGAKSTDAIIKEHPHPHRLNVFAQLEAKNIGIVLADADLEVAAKQLLLGSLSYNGQRCTACKLIMAHSSVVVRLTEKIVAGVKDLKKGLPWEGANITPLPEPTKPDYCKELVDDAVAKGAKLVNAADGGGQRFGNLYMPAVLSDVTSEMRIFHEEQFGPVVPIVSFKDVSEVITAAKEGWNGQQAAIFATDGSAAAPLVDALSTIVGRINLNAQCSRGPDVFPFAGRRASSVGTMSVVDCLRGFSVEVLVAHPDNEANRKTAFGVEETAQFFAPLPIVRTLSRDCHEHH